MNYGLPEKAVSDQGHSFESKIIAGLCKLTENEKL